MKIIHLTHSMQIGGIETMLVNIVNEQVKNHEVILMFLNDDYDVKLLANVSQTVKIINVGRRLGSKNIFDIIKLNTLIIREHPDILHLHHASLNKLLFYPAIVGRKVFTMHDIPSPQDIKDIVKFRNIKQIFSISKAVKDCLSESGFPSVLVENGINFNEFEKCTSSNSSNYRIIQVGRLDLYKKGQDISILAIKQITERGIKNIHLDIVGEGKDEETIRKLIREHNLGKYVSLMGKKSQEWLHHHYKDYSLFIQPSRKEGFGLTVVEAIAAKIPVLVSDQEGPMEIIKAGEYGFYFKSEDIVDCANMIEKIKGLNDISILTTAAYTYAYKHYSVEQTANKYLYHYTILVN